MGATQRNHEGGARREHRAPIRLAARRENAMTTLRIAKLDHPKEQILESVAPSATREP